MIRSSESILRISSLLFLFAFVGSTYVPCENCADRATVSELQEISLLIYTGESVDEYTTELVGSAINLLDKIDSAKPTVLYISGWTESPSSTSVQTVLNAYLERQDHNILVADYSDIANTEWDFASSSAEGVGYTFATALDEMVAQGLDSTTLHVVGHSLGGQVSGFIGKYTNFTVPRITALDPAGPSFGETDDHLSSSDATFVDIIHTNPKAFGTSYHSGTLDFWPNGDTGVQPGCENDDALLAYSCSHYRSWMYYAESLSNEEAFLSVVCDSYELFEAGSCSSGETIYMGYAASSATASGDLTLQTNSESPYGLGTAGITYSA